MKTSRNSKRRTGEQTNTLTTWLKRSRATIDSTTDVTSESTECVTHEITDAVNNEITNLTPETSDAVTTEINDSTNGISKIVESSKDLGKFYLNTDSLTDIQKYELLTHSLPPPTSNFPKIKMYGKNRSFQWIWMEKYNGLVYSPCLEGGLCKYCILFSKKRSELGILVTRPFTQLAKASEVLGDHFGREGKEAKQSHKEALADALAFKEVMESKALSIDRQVDLVVKERVEENRTKLKSILRTVILCGRQNIALRGHRDDAKHLTDDRNPGNFQALLDFRIEAGDKKLEEHFKTASKNCTYRSKTTQNELIEVCGDHIRQKLIKEIRDSVFFSISADEVADSSNTEQLALVIRFVDSDDNIREEFMGFVACTGGTDGETLSKTILHMMEDTFGLDMLNCRGQAYDGAGAMAGKVKGVATRISKKYPKAHYMHCAAHVLNLCIVKALNIRIIQNMMDLADGVFKFFHNSPKRQLGFDQTVDEWAGESTRKNLKEMCRTRWVERHEAFETFCALYEPVVMCLDMMCNDACVDWNRDTQKDARALLSGLTQFQFIISLVVTNHVMAYLKTLSIGFQGRGVDILKANSQLETVVKTVQNVRDNVDDFHNTWYSEASAIAEAVDVKQETPRCAVQMLHRQNVPAETPKMYYRRNLTIPLLDHLLTELNTRFSEHSKRSIAMMSIIPAIHIPQKGSKEELIEVLKPYFDDLPSPGSVDAEVHTWITKWKDVAPIDLPDTGAKTLHQTDRLFFPNIHTLLQILCTFPVTSSECERSISGIRRLKTYLRTTMEEKRMNGLLLMHLHYTMPMDTDTIIDDFARRNPRRMELLDILQ